jgi:hypothetical protein
MFSTIIGTAGIRIEDTILSAPRERSVALLLRHSARYPIPDESDPYQAQLTSQGVAMAEDLGKWLNQNGYRLDGFFSSPVGRCIDTAHGIARGAGYAANVRAERVLSFPFMQPTRRNIVNFRSSDPLPDRVVESLRFMVKTKQSTPAIHIYVSHDSYLACILAHIFLEPIEEHWPDFLEGMALWQEESSILLSWRGRLKYINGVI